MYNEEVRGTGEPVVVLHRSLMTITSNWHEMIAAVEDAEGHRRGNAQLCATPVGS
jgi:hypothetical protein